MPQPYIVKVMSRFDSCAVPGIIVGYFLQPGAELAEDYQVFSMSYFEGYDCGQCYALTHSIAPP